MEKIELYPGIHSSKLAFGCASIMGAKSANESKKAIFCALDNGINHFDVARSYGYGEAERFVGKQFRQIRSNIILASKFGIINTPLSRLMRPIKPIVRAIRSTNRQIHREQSEEKKILIENNGTDFFHKRINITRGSLIKNLEQSLKSLKTDYLDYYFIHEPFNSIENIDDIIDSANRQKENGKIRAFGLASDINFLHLHETYLDVFDLLQFNPIANLNKVNSCIIKERKSKPNVLFAPLKSELGRNPKDIFENLKQKYPKSIILCSMFNQMHIIENSSFFNN